MTLCLLTWEDVLSEVRLIEQYPLEVLHVHVKGNCDQYFSNGCRRIVGFTVIFTFIGLPW